MKKIGIITWDSHDNYGSVLQAYALLNKIKKADNDVEFIKYKPKTRKKSRFDLSFKYYTKQFFNKIAIKKYEKEFHNIHELFSKFRDKNFKYSEYCEGYTDLRRVCNSYDKVVCGSDQIWSPNAYDENYFLSFLNDSKKIAYAPSIGVSKISNIELLKKMQEMIQDFKYLSFREEIAKEILGCKNAKVVLDPTLLYNSEEWDELLNFKEKENKNEDKDKYILCYFLANNFKYNKIAERIAKITNYKIKYIPINKNTLLEKDKMVLNCGPREFVKSIRNASYVITDSYHGMIFSIIYNKQFFVLERFNKNNKESQNSRIYNLVNKYNLNDRLINDINDIENLQYHLINYNIVNDKLKIERKESISYLINAINNEYKKDEPINIKDIKCTGCGMCVSICPKKCITMELNENGFYSAKIDESKCINCGLCKKTCGQHYNKSVSLSHKRMYSIKSKDIDIVKQSASGGAAFEISKWAIKNNIPVIGCTYNYQKNIAEHMLVENEKDLSNLAGSKYLPSYTVNAFEKIKNIDTGVIFGLPCQIASINRYLEILGKRDNFVLIDLICHGVPTYNLWKHTIKNKVIKKVNFRNKTKGWHKKILTINDKKIKNKYFYNFFDYNLVYNECCYNCNYRSKSNADIRLGDYWGPKYKNEKNGISMVISISDRGDKIINENDNIIKNNELIDDYYIGQQYENELIPIDYYNIMNALKNSEINWNTIYKKYCRKRVYERNIKKYGYKLFKFIKKFK